jgi:hypothetical protein
MPGQRRPELNVTGLVAGAAATVSATVAASYFGVGGTLIGAGAVSVLSTVGATYYQHVLDRGKAQIAAKIPVRVAAGGDGSGAPDETPSQRTGGRSGGRAWPKWYVLAGAAVGVFLAVMGLVTAFELVTGKPLANTVQGRAGHGTSVDPVRTDVRPGPLPRPTGDTTPYGTPTPSARPSAESTPLTTPTPVASAPAPPRRPLTSEAPLGPAATRSPAAQQPTQPPDDEDLRTPGP